MRTQNEVDEGKILSWITNILSWYDDLPANGKLAANQWLRTGNISPILKFLEEPLASYFSYDSGVILEKESLFSVFVNRAAVVGF